MHLELVGPVHQQAACWWEREAHRAFVLSSQALVWRVRKKLASLAGHLFITKLVPSLQLPAGESVYVLPLSVTGWQTALSGVSPPFPPLPPFPFSPPSPPFLLP